MKLKDLYKVQRKHQKNLLKKANAVSVGCGYKVVDGKKTDRLCIVVGVVKKVDLTTLSKRDIIPAAINGIEIDVIIVGQIIAYPKGKEKRAKAAQIDPKNKLRPAMPGISIGHKCYDPLTRVLTSTGLKFFREISTNDDIATLSSENELKWQKPTDLFEYDYEGDMLHFEGRTIDLCVTPNHNLYYCNKYKKNGFNLAPAEQVIKENAYHSIQFKRNCEWHCTDFKIITIEPDGYNVKHYRHFQRWSGSLSDYSKKYGIPYKTIWRWRNKIKKPRAFNHRLNFKSKHWVEFLGWYLSEGSLSRNTISISEKSRQYHKEISKLFHQMNLRAHITKDGDIRFTHKSIATYLKQFGRAHEKYIPQEIKDLPPEKLRILLDALMKGDGHISDGKYRHYKTVSRQLAHDVFEIGLKCGFGVTIQEYEPIRGGIIDGRIIKSKHISYRIGFSHVKLTPRLDKKPFRTRYKGKIYCLEVPNHVIFVERNGKACWCGNSITAGTFGCVVRKNGERMILSNNHVLANSNDAEIGDAILQPGPTDSGTSDDQLAVLESFVPLIFSSSGGPGPPPCGIANSTASIGNAAARLLGRKHRLVAINPEAATNEVDAAIARPLNDADITDQIVQIGTPVGIIEPTIGMQVQKYGRTTQHTTNSIVQINTTVNVGYGAGKTAQFVGQVMALDMSEPGDSGSAILDMESNLVGLLFAGSSEVTIFNPISKVFELLQILL